MKVARTVLRPLSRLYRATTQQHPILVDNIHPQSLFRRRWQDHLSTHVHARWLRGSGRSCSSEAPLRTASTIGKVRPPADHTYMITFTCKRCQVRSSHKMSGQAYHHGSVLITCPGCKNRHVISDHLGVYSPLIRYYEWKSELNTGTTVESEADVEMVGRYSRPPREDCLNGRRSNQSWPKGEKRSPRRPSIRRQTWSFMKMERSPHLLPPSFPTIRHMRSFQPSILRSGNRDTRPWGYILVTT